MVYNTGSGAIVPYNLLGEFTMSTPTKIKLARSQSSFVTCESKFSTQQIALFTALFASADALNNAVQKAHDDVVSALVAMYGDTAPTYDQYMSDRACLKIVAEERGLVDDQWLRKPYCAAIKAHYGALPVSMTEAAIAKRASRPVADKTKAKPGAKKDVPVTSTAPATCEQLIAQFGTATVLRTLAKILAAERESALDGKTLQAIADHYSAPQALAA
jgi:hypothetical protein